MTRWCWRGGVGGTIVDVIGQVGVDSGSEWTGGGQDDTLRRLSTVCAGDTNPSDAFTFATEWATFANNTFGGLGSHTANCGVVSVNLTITDVSANEGNSGTTSFDFVVSLSSPAGAGGVTFDIATAG